MDKLSKVFLRLGIKELANEKALSNLLIQYFKK